MSDFAFKRIIYSIIAFVISTLMITLFLKLLSRLGISSYLESHINLEDPSTIFFVDLLLSIFGGLLGACIARYRS